MDKNTYAGLLQDDRARYYRIAYSYVKNEHDALDIVGEAAYRGLCKLHTLKSPEHFRTWMTRIVMNCAIDHIRRSSRTVSLGEAPVAESWDSGETFRCEDNIDLYDALDSLSERDRTCIVLRFFEEYSFAEIARVLEEPESTVKARVYRTLKRLRVQLEKGDS